ncbi:MAG: hypothetical protein AAF658_00500, partial [Myxococcota bacterium]
GALGQAPMYQPVDPAVCAVELPGVQLEPVELEATSPWGISMQASSRHFMYLPKLDTEKSLLEEITRTAATCVGGGSGPDRLRFVLERIETNTFSDLSPAVSTARVIVRVERFRGDFSRFASRRFDGAFRAPIGSTAFDELLLAATRAALREALEDTEFLSQGQGA